MNEAFAQLKVAFLKELPVINAAIGHEIDALPALVRPVAAHVMDAGGKRLRPMLTILFARALGFRGENLHTLASSLEFLHSATLMHDDILDNADLRRENRPRIPFSASPRQCWPETCCWPWPTKSWPAPAIRP
jgi:octaprenyl-diphosphate synthase